ncbi:FAD-dependent oxidoreductase [Streptomyces sp. NPDC058614]|uniref:flavin monoamine oxidase family protein n=1 Tax=Streptomyces sp. NPDC058614 TaxID=3346557 RepID=UPI003666F4A4
MSGMTRRWFLTATGAVVAAGAASACDTTATGGSRTTPHVSSLPEPVAFLRTSWSTDPFALGSYSCLAPSPLGVSVREILAAPVGRLHFAGEATSGEAPATQAGALLSGRRAAAEIIEAAGPGGHVIVVGSGFSGLGCARDLTDAGLRVTVIEGRDRVGGRTWTERLDGIPAEMGASWIHGHQGNPLTALLRETGGRSYSFDYDNVVGGDENAVAELDKYLAKAEDVEDPDTTPYSALLPRKMSPALRYAVNSVLVQEYGAEPEDLAVSADEEGTAGEGSDFLLPDGYDRLLAHVRGSIPVRTGAVVTGIARDADGVAVTLDSGEILRADRCVVTVPIGVLKAGKITFEPALPTRKREAVEALGSGLLDKLWLQFPSVFWDKKADAIEWFDPTDPGRWSLWVNGHRAFGKPVLLGFNAGRPAHDHAHLTDRQVVDSAMDALRRMHA